jgi:hypothetical protein
VVCSIRPRSRMPPLASRTQKTLYRLTRLCLRPTGSLRLSVSLRSAMEVDSDRDWTFVGCGCWCCHRPTILQHPFYLLPEPDPPANPYGIKLSCRLTPFLTPLTPVCPWGLLPRDMRSSIFHGDCLFHWVPLQLRSSLTLHYQLSALGSHRKPLQLHSSLPCQKLIPTPLTQTPTPFNSASFRLSAT